METMEATYSKKVFPRGRAIDNPANVLIASGQKPTKKPHSSSSSNASCFEPFEGEAGTLNGAAWVPRLEGAPTWGAPFSEMFYEGEKKMTASFGVGPTSVASAKLQSGGRDRSPKGRIASPALPLNLVFASRDKESLLEEIICLKQILNDQAAFLQRNKVYASTVQAENRKLERDIEDLETGGVDNKSQGGTSRLRVKFQGILRRSLAPEWPLE